MSRQDSLPDDPGAPGFPVGDHGRLLWDHANDAITIIDQDGRILRANSRFSQMLGYDAEEASRLYLEDVIHPEDLEMVRERHLRRLRGGDSPATYTARCVRKDGTVLFLQTTSSVVTDASGREASLDILRDITRQVQAEKKIEEHNLLLAETNRRYQDLLDFMTHELKNPLTMIRAYSELLVEGAGGRLTRKGQRISMNLWRSTNRMEHLISTYLHLSRIEGGTVVVHRERCKFVEEILDWAVDFLSIQLEANDVTVVIDPSGLPEAVIDVDRELMRTAVQNILTNAIKYGYRSTPITVRLSEEPGRLVASFRNHGVGISVENLEDVFKKWSRTASRGDNPLRSSGIGLYLVKRIVEEHGGDVWMDSKQGEWAEATLSLPGTGSAR